MSAILDYDTGPLNWVRSDIEAALQAALGRVQAYGADADLTNALRLARDDAHQVAGALRMVGLEGAATVASALETTLTDINEGRQQATDELFRAVRNTIEGLLRWIKELADGHGSGELALFPLYRRLRELQGAERVFEGELFFPDLRSRVRGIATITEQSGEALAAQVKTARAAFQRGLLAFLRGQSAEQGLKHMRDALAHVENVAPSQAAQTFWWACVGFIDSLIAHGVEADFHVKQLLARIDLQMRRLMEGSPQVAERLLRDALFFVAKSQSMEGRAAEVRATFTLDRYLPGKGLLDPETLARLRPVLDALKTGLKSARDFWHLHVEGSGGDQIKNFQSQLDRMQTQPDVGGEALSRLLNRLAESAEASTRLSSEQREPLNLEIAATLLFLQNAVESEDVLRADFSGRAHSQNERLQALSEGRALPQADALLDAGSRRAAERDMLHHLAQEVGVNLKQMEEALDMFFRDPDQREGLAQLPRLAKQAQGALTMLELEEASALLGAAVNVVQAYVADGYPTDSTKDHVADAFSSLGLYIEAHCAGRADAIRILQPVLADFGLLAPDVSIDSMAEESIEAGLDRRKSGVKAAYLAWRDEGGEAPQKKFLEALVELGRDAELIDDPGLKRAVDVLLAASRNSERPASELDDHVVALTGEALPPRAEVFEFEISHEAGTTVLQDIESSRPGFDVVDYGAVIEYATPSDKGGVAQIVEADNNEPATVAEFAEATTLPKADIEKITPDSVTAVVPEGSDPELLEIFLEEAGEVLGAMGNAVATCHANPDDRDSLTVIRRGFHTLKGSGRMVGLTELGETAWGMEHFMNGWLAEDKPANSELLDVVSQARQFFQDWIGALQAGSPLELSASALLACADRVAYGMPCESVETELAPVDMTAVDKPAGDQATEISEPEVLAETESSPLTEPQIEPEDVVVGDVHLSPGLFDIFMVEAQQRLASLLEEIGRFAEVTDGTVSEAAQRAAHTLAGIAGTAGFFSLSDLAHALELYWNRFESKPMPEAHRPLVSDTVLRLQAMLDDINASQAPQSASDLIAALGELEDEQAEHPINLANENEVFETGHLPADEEMSPLAMLHDAALHDDDAGIAEAAEIPEVIIEQALPMENAPSQGIPDLAGLIPEIHTKAPVPVFERREVKDEIDPQLLPIFVEEAETLVPDTSAQLRLWKAKPQDNAARDVLRRNLHTIKGSARMAGAMRLGELTHVMESRVIAAIEGQMEASTEVFEALEAEFDRLADAVERLKLGETSEAVEAPVEVPLEPALEKPADLTASIPDEQVAAQPIVHDAQALTLRVRADWVDRMVNQAGEVAIARSRIENEMFNFKRHVSELSDALSRLRSHIREVEIQAESQMQSSFQTQGPTEHFDPLEFDRFTRFQEVTRFLAESVNDISTVQHILLARLGEADAALLHQTRLNRELQQNLLRVRMVPLYSVAERLYRTVRQTARDVDKRAQLDIQGGDLEIDRSVLEKVTAPIEHLLRNALAHGIETPEVRKAAGKTEFGEITLTARQSGNEMMLTVKDDGAGLHFSRIREKALAQGLLTPGIEPTEVQLAQMIFAAGFSTAEQVSEVSGRGVGMDVVKSEIAALGGRIDISSKTGAGTQFNIYLPLTLALTQAVMFSAAKRDYALPTTLIQQVLELKPGPLAAAMNVGEVEWRGARYPLTYLPHLLGHADAIHEVQRFNSVVLLKSGNSQAAILVDAIEGTREIVVKNIGPQLARVTGIAGATVRGDGRVILILNPIPLALRWMRQPRETIKQMAPTQAPEGVEALQAPRVLVVDDSLTVRKITSRLLTREGFRVDTAKDGVDALEKMQDLIPDVVLLDVEMPRMDGFELARVMRNDARLKSVPIIMITSRTAEKHRSHALEIGVNVYMGKPYQEQQLLDNIAEQIGQKVLM